MAKKIKPRQLPGKPDPVVKPEEKIPVDPEEPLTTEEDPEIIPDPDAEETSPYEIPSPGEGP